MPKVHLIASEANAENQWADREYERVVSLSNQSSIGSEMTDDPRVADVIIFVGCSQVDMWDVRRHRAYREYPEKCFLLSASDRFHPYVRGLYPSIEKRWHHPSRTRSICYPRVAADPGLNALAPRLQDEGNRPLLFSFRGNASTDPVRQKLMRLRHAHGRVTDTGAQSYAAENREAFRDEICDSHFVLCPRGGGVSSFRIFESMAMGRPPVIVSDQWVQPEGPDWTSFSVRVAERDVKHIPARLSELRGLAPEMGRRARDAFEQYFSSENYFDYLVGQCIAMQQVAPQSMWGRLTAKRQLLHPWYFRKCVLRRVAKTIKGTSR